MGGRGKSAPACVHILGYFWFSSLAESHIEVGQPSILQHIHISFGMVQKSV
jgi:hypothetical protein